jgi:hypothetical protein
MSFTHLNDDECERKIAVKESVGPGNYYVNTPLQCGMCYQPNPSIIAQKGSVSQNTGVDHRFYSGPVDVESDLFNINRVASRCPHEKYNPDCPDCQCSNQGQPCGQGGVAGCSANGKQMRKKGQMCNDNNLVDYPDCMFPVEPTRLSNPPSNLRGTGINRFEPLCLDPQYQITFPGNYQVPTRLVIKDNHRPIYPSLRTISTPLINPNPKPLPCHPTTPVCGNNVLPMYAYGRFSRSSNC